MPRNQPRPEDLPWYRAYWIQLAQENPRTDLPVRSVHPPGSDERAEAVIDILIMADVWPERKKAAHEAQPTRHRPDDTPDHRTDRRAALD